MKSVILLFIKASFSLREQRGKTKTMKKVYIIPSYQTNEKCFQAKYKFEKVQLVRRRQNICME